MSAHLDQAVISPWVARWAHLIKPAQAMLDVACGAGRHTQFFAQRGCAVTALDISLVALQAVAKQTPSARIVQADIENAPWPLEGETFDAVVVTNYLWRPVFPQLLASLKEGGILIYETFAVGNETVGKPSRLDFLLRSQELLSLCKDLHIVAYEDGFLTEPSRFVQRVVAAKVAAKMSASSDLLKFHL
ncbi:MAG: class I SAM-dependent methyltransferase [Cytophagales bacterium]|nr:class I SAM-dependent methyltransferase [Cytophagales bacterium]